MKQQMSEFDCFLITYDEPNAEDHWADLLRKVPWAKRIHKIKGFDEAHKECARQSQTDRFITIDGDNIVNEKFFDLILDIPDEYSKCVLSWNSTNIINGLVYGNGGIKLWTKEWVLKMKTHENAESNKYVVDFCWDNTYLQLNSVYSTTYPNGSDLQAFRAGFREGCKMTLNAGIKVDKLKIKNLIHDSNFKRLMIWSSIGADVNNGLAAILGTRLGIYETNINDTFDIANISDYDWFYKFASEKLINHAPDDINKILLIESLGDKIAKHLDIELCLFNAEQSKFFKKVYEYNQSQYSINLEHKIIGI
jgi:hypothetical protein